MKFFNKGFSLLFSVIIIIFATFSLSSCSVNTQNAETSSKYLTDMVSLYQQYDPDYSTLDINDKFALKRLIVFDYNGKKYGACKVVENTLHNYALLQYKSSTDAAAAYDKLCDEGFFVETDSLSTVDSYEECKLNKDYSNALGIDDYISDFAIEADDVLVAVLDTGVMLEHDDLKDRFYNRGYDYTADGNADADYDKNNESVYFHGTFVSGVIADNTMDNVKIVPFKVVPYGSTAETLSACFSAIYAATDMGVDVINASFSSPFGSVAYDKAVEYAVDNGVCVCASAGNDNSLMSNCYPAMTDEVITVSALNSKLTKLAGYSNYGAEIDFCAPGTAVCSTLPKEDGSSGYASYSGTSFATPFISAVCANIKSMNTHLTKSQVYNIMKDFSVDYGDEGVDSYYGYGMPKISDIVYENDAYRLCLPQGTVELYKGVDYTENTQPWAFVANKIKNVSIKNDVDRIGSYSFYNLTVAEFDYNNTFNSVGDYAFYGCKKLENITFDTEIQSIGNNAFGKISDDFTVIGYSNTVAEAYCNSEKIKFQSLGCNHDFLMKNVYPSDSDSYTQYTCTVCGYSYKGEYTHKTTVITGTCGENLTFSIDNFGELSIDGTGEMYDYTLLDSPWSDCKDSIRTVTIGENVSGISPFAFYKCSAIYSYSCCSSNFKVVNRSLYSSDGKKLICCALTSSGEYVMPDELEKFDATAFLNVSNLIVIPNDKFTVNNSIVYDAQGNIVMVTPDFNSTVLTLSEETTVKKYAFILTDYPETIRVYSSDVKLEDYSVGYSYNGKEFVKNKFTYYGDVDSPAYKYAENNGFESNLLNMGSCGEKLIWHYNYNTSVLSIKGTGDMYQYKSREAVGWYDYMGEIKAVTIDDGVTSLSPYAFYGGENIIKVTMPLSVDAPANQTVWYGCKGIQIINLTQGSGIMDDYATVTNPVLYTYTPWYISECLTELNLSKDVKYIGVNAFRGCNGISDVTLNNCETIARCAFFDCSNLQNFTNYSKNTVYAAKSILYYKNEPVNPMAVYCYEDSTTKDFIDEMDCLYISLGCEHSRGLTENGTLPNCCYDVTVNYDCVDCKKTVYSTYLTAKTQGHFIKATVKDTENCPISDAEVYLDGELAAVTNTSGKFVIDNVKCSAVYEIVVKKHGFVIAKTQIKPYKYNLRGNIQIKYGDFVKDGVVNGKDFAYAIRNNFDDAQNLDFGIVENEIADINENYNNQSHPMVTDIYNEPNESYSSRRDFYSHITLGSEYKVVECGYIYGKNMDDEFMVLENVGTKNELGFNLKKTCYTIDTFVKALTYGSSDSTGKVSARFYIIYTNGVKNYTCYSDVSSYSY